MTKRAGELLQAARARLAPHSETASSDAQRLLCLALGVERPFLLAHPEFEVSQAQSEQFSTWVERCASGEPLAYILGRWPWYDREFWVTPDVLIPRPETELLLEAALRAADDMPEGAALDVGTGSGILAVTFAALRPNWQVQAVDFSEQALAVARRNAELHAVSNHLTFFCGDLLTPIPAAQRWDVVMANLPYIPAQDVDGLLVSRHEPRLALDGGGDGLSLIRRLLTALVGRVQPKGRILLEIENRQGLAAGAIAQANFPQAHVEVLRDYAGHDRIVEIHLPHAL